MAEILLLSSLKVAVSMLVLSGVDYAYERFRHERDLRMTPQEIRAEQRIMQGDPQLASRRRALARRVAQPAAQETVSKADLIITSPAGQAIAISYDPASNEPPRVVAKGDGVAAVRIQTWGTRHSVPSVEQPRLAAELFATAEVAQPISANLYAGVAQLLLQAERTVAGA